MATAAKTAATTDEVRGTNWLAEHVNSETGSTYDGYSVRILLRSLAKEGVVERGEGRYSFSGPRDKTVLAVVKAVKSGDAAKAKQAKLDELKAKRDAKAPAAKKAAEAPKPARSRAKAKPAPAVEEDDDDLDIDEV